MFRIAFALALCVASSVHAYPGGTPAFVTDVAPFCASCHSSLSADQLIGSPPQRAQAELVEEKHLAKIRAAREGSAYADLDEAQRAELIADVQAIDAAGRVELSAPASLAPGQTFEVTVTATGGGGPVVGVALVDSNQRWQARPASAIFKVLEPARVIGPDGQPQTRFMAGRNPALAPGTSYVNVYGVKALPDQGQFSRVSVTWRLRAPTEKGTHPLAAAFLYGTEKGSRHGAVESLRGPQPLGGFGANSGRVRFSEVVQIEVK